MKKTFIVFLTLITSIQSLSQDYKVLLTKPIDWKDIEIEISDSSKMEIIKSVNHWLIKDYYNQNDWVKLQEDLEKFKFIDLDMNNDLEIVYEGFSGGEPIGVTILKKNSIGNYSEVFSRFGTIESLWRTSLNGNMYFELIHWPCCAGITYSLERWKFDGSNFKLVEKINWISETKFPNTLSSARKFKVLNDPYKLRSSPEILEDNLLTTYRTGDLGYTLAKTVDDTGRTWWFVFMLNNQTNSNTFYDYAYDDPYYSVGWMSSRFVELISK